MGGRERVSEGHEEGAGTVGEGERDGQAEMIVRYYSRQRDCEVRIHLIT